MPLVFINIKGYGNVLYKLNNTGSIKIEQQFEQYMIMLMFLVLLIGKTG